MILETRRRYLKGKKMPVLEISLADLMDSSDWAQVFADESYGNTDKCTDPCPPNSNVDLTPPNRSDVAEIIAAIEGERDQGDWLGVFRLKDGRFLLACGGCDYTGWD